MNLASLILYGEQWRDVDGLARFFILVTTRPQKACTQIEDVRELTHVPERTPTKEIKP